MPVECWCAPQVFLATVDDDVIVLDLESDRYTCLLEAAKVIRIEPQGRIILEAREIEADLLEVGIIATVRPEQDRPLLSPPRRQATVCERPGSREIFDAALSMSVGSLIFRGKTLAELVRYRPAQPESTTAATLEELVGSARKARSWIPFEGECLKRSFLLKRFLASRGFAADWVFGVRTWPFAAHCWLQIDDLVVGDRLERVGRFTPIMRIQP